jgi:hypothetical protein
MTKIISFDEARTRPKAKATGAAAKLQPPLTANERIDLHTESIEFVYETILDLLQRIEALEERTRLFEPEGARL